MNTYNIQGTIKANLKIDFNISARDEAQAIEQLHSDLINSGAEILESNLSVNAIGTAHVDVERQPDE